MLPEITFIRINDRIATNDTAKKVLKEFCKKDHVRSNKALLSSVIEDKGYNAADLKKLYDNCYGNNLKLKVYPQYSQYKDCITPEKPEGSAYKKLKEMIGLESVKTIIDQAVTYSKIQKLLADRGMPNSRRSMHMVFSELRVQQRPRLQDCSLRY